MFSITEKLIGELKIIKLSFPSKSATLNKVITLNENREEKKKKHF